MIRTANAGVRSSRRSGTATRSRVAGVVGLGVADVDLDAVEQLLGGGVERLDAARPAARRPRPPSTVTEPAGLRTSIRGGGPAGTGTCVRTDMADLLGRGSGGSAAGEAGVAAGAAAGGRGRRRAGGAAAATARTSQVFSELPAAAAAASARALRPSGSRRLIRTVEPSSSPASSATVRPGSARVRAARDDDHLGVAAAEPDVDQRRRRAPR